MLKLVLWVLLLVLKVVKLEVEVVVAVEIAQLEADCSICLDVHHQYLLQQ